MANHEWNNANAKQNEAHEQGRHSDIPKKESVLLLWVDSNLDENSEYCKDTINLLHRAVNDVYLCMNDDDCLYFVQTITDRKICMIISGSLGQRVVPRIHELSQIDTIFIFCNDQKYHEGWARQWSKIRGVFTDIMPICDALQEAAKKCEQNAVSMSVVPNGNLNELSPSFMYTQILKEILLTIDFEKHHIQDYINYCREVYADNEKELKNVRKLENEYNKEKAIWWYTFECFFYKMLNNGLRNMDGDIITRMGFFIKDLCQHIKKEHDLQYAGQSSAQSFTVYRGQGLSQEDFNKIEQTKGGLISFHNFLSTSIKREISYGFAQDELKKPDTVAILYVIKIDPSQTTTPFASVRHLSAASTEDEILFSMHSVFRIHGIKSLNGSNRFYEISLSLTSDNDKDLRALTDYIREATFPDTKGWYRLGLVLNEMGQHTKAEEVYSMLLNQTTDENEEASIYHQLGSIKDKQGDYEEAIEFYKKSLDIEQKKTPVNQMNVANSYNNIGVAYDNLNDYSEALFYYEKALAIRQQAKPPNLPDLALTYNNIGVVYKNMNNYPKALTSYEKALKIQEDTLLPNHPQLGSSCNNIGLMYEQMNNYTKARSFFERAVQIGEKSLPANHPHLLQRRKNLERAKMNM